MLSRRGVLILGALLLLTGCTSAGSTTAFQPAAAPPPAQPAAVAVTGALSPAQYAQIRGLASSLSTPVGIDRISFGPTPASASGADVVDTPGALWMNVSSTATNHLTQMRADWQADLVVAATWRSFAAKKLGVVAGADLVGSEQFFFTARSPSYLFTDESGKPSALTVNRVAFVQAVVAGAARDGLRVASIGFSGLLGTVAEVDLVAPHPQAWIAKQSHAFGDPPIDAGSLEGLFVTLRDPQGRLILAWSYATGLQQGAELPGTTYASQLHIGDASSAPASR